MLNRIFKIIIKIENVCDKNNKELILDELIDKLYKQYYKKK